MSDVNLNALQPVNNAEEHRFEIRLGDDIALIDYMLNGRNITITHTEVPPAFEGQGIAGKLAKFALDWAKENDYKVNPLCPYVKSYINRHPEYQDNAWGY